MIENERENLREGSGSSRGLRRAFALLLQSLVRRASERHAQRLVHCVMEASPREIFDYILRESRERKGEGSGAMLRRRT